MKQFYVRDAAEHLDKIIQSVFVTRSKQVRTKKNGEAYIAMQLADKTGCLDAKLWHHVDVAIPIIGASEFLVVRGRVSKYNDRNELVIEKLRSARKDEVDVSDFLPKCEADTEELWTRLLQYVESVQDEAIKALLTSFVADDEIATRLKVAPAAKLMHHAYIGGLLEHIVSLCRMAEFASLAYPWVNRDILVAGALLHDIGKIHELQYTTSLDYSDEGKLLGHINFGVQMLRSKLANSPVPRDTAIEIEHLILSHHGSKELGSPVEPSTSEAIVFSHLDNLDAKAFAIRDAQASRHHLSAWTELVQHSAARCGLANSSERFLRTDEMRCAKTPSFLLGMLCNIRHITRRRGVSIGTSGRIVIEISPEIKRELYAVLSGNGETLKDWFLRCAEEYVRTGRQLPMFQKELSPASDSTQPGLVP